MNAAPKLLTGTGATCIETALVPASNQITRISTKDASRIYKVPYSKLRLWADEGRVCAPERRGRELFWNPEEIEQMLELLGTRKRLPRGSLRDVG